MKYRLIVPRLREIYVLAFGIGIFFGYISILAFDWQGLLGAIPVGLFLVMATTGISIWYYRYFKQRGRFVPLLRDRAMESTERAPFG
jgi:hypothetical protein